MADENEAMPNVETFRVTAPPPEAGVIVFVRADRTPNITIRPTGEVKLAPGLEISEASRLFWQGLADAFPAWRAEVIAAAALPDRSAIDDAIWRVLDRHNCNGSDRRLRVELIEAVFSVMAADNKENGND